MTEADRALVGKVERFGGQIDRGLCRIIRELEAERDGVVQNLASANRRRNAANDRWRHAGRTIRRYRDWWVQTRGALDIIADLMHRYHRRWQWERRRADEKDFEIAMRNIAESQRRDLVLHHRGVIKRLRAERDSFRAERDNACQLVARMHEAATGVHGGGAILGVVEDVAALRARCERLREALLPYEREHARDYPSPVDCQCSYCNDARAALKEEKS